MLDVVPPRAAQACSLSNGVCSLRFHRVGRQDFFFDLCCRFTPVEALAVVEAILTPPVDSMI